MSHSPYESPREVSDTPQRHRFHWNLLYSVGVLIIAMSILALVAFVISGENPERLGVAGVDAGKILAGSFVIGAGFTIVGGIGWLMSWLWQKRRS